MREPGVPQVCRVGNLQPGAESAEDVAAARGRLIRGAKFAEYWHHDGNFFAAPRTTRWGGDRYGAKRRYVEIDYLARESERKRARYLVVNQPPGLAPPRWEEGKRGGAVWEGPGEAAVLGPPQSSGKGEGVGFR